MNEVGEKLKEARKEKGYSLDDLQQMTKIQKRYLAAIEEGNLEVLPGNFYARAFIKQYADTVGLDGEKLLADYTDYIPSPNDEHYSENMATTQTRSKVKKNDWVSRLQQNLPVILIILLVLAIVLAIYIAMIQNDSGQDESMIVQNTSDSVQISTNTGVQEQSEETDTASEEETDTSTDTTEAQTVEVASSDGEFTTYTVSGALEEEVVLTLSAEDADSWVSVEADGESLNEGLIAAGDSMELTIPSDAQSVYVVVGNAPATLIELNGESISYPPEAEGVITQRLTFEFAE